MAKVALSRAQLKRLVTLVEADCKDKKTLGDFRLIDALNAMMPVKVTKKRAVKKAE